LSLLPVLNQRTPISVIAIGLIIAIDLLISVKAAYSLMTHIAKVVEIIGGSDKGWSEAAQAALDEAKKTIHGITGLEVNDITAKVDPSTGKITEHT
jgi:flavin-binding protein dodecin